MELRDGNDVHNVRRPNNTGARAATTPTTTAKRQQTHDLFTTLGLRATTHVYRHVLTSRERQMANRVLSATSATPLRGR